MEQNYRWKVHKSTKYGLRQDRYLLLDLQLGSMMFLDTNNKCKSEFRLSEIQDVVAINSKKGSHDKRKIRMSFVKDKNRPYDIKFESHIDCQKFLQLFENKELLKKNDKRGSGDFTNLKEYPVQLKSGISTSQPRLVILNPSKSSLLILDMKRKCKKEVGFKEISSIEIPRSKDNMAGETCHMMMNNGDNAIKLNFEREDERIDFCDTLRDLEESIEIKDYSLAGDPECLRFNVAKINKFGVLKERVIYIDSKKGVFRSINLNRTYKEVLIKSPPDKHTIGGGINLVGIERNANNKCRLDLEFKNREPLHFLLESPFQRERFLHRCRTLTVPQYYDHKVLDESAFFEEQALTGAGLIDSEQKKQQQGKEVINSIEEGDEKGKEDDEKGKMGLKEDKGSKDGIGDLNSLLEDRAAGSNTSAQMGHGGSMPELTTQEKGSSNHVQEEKLSSSMVASLSAMQLSNKKLKMPTANWHVAFHPNAVSVFIGTWNVAQNIVYDSLDDFIPPSKYDIYAIGLQECRIKDRNKWQTELERHINLNYRGKVTKNTYDLIKHHALREINLFLFVRKNLTHAVTNIEAQHVACGVGNVVGNKGGVAVSINLYDTKLCFVTCHLAARSERLDERRNDFRRICKEMSLGTQSMDMLSQFHHVFWFGDLNYRTVGEFSDIQTIWKGCKETGEWKEMWDTDQLKGEREKKRVFYGFVEGPLHFGPTYRFNKKSNEFSNKNFQNPSWTDRILYHSLPGLKVVSKNYYSAPNVFGSDHRPVASVFEFVPFPSADVLQPTLERRCKAMMAEVSVSNMTIKLDMESEDMKDKEISEMTSSLTVLSSVDSPLQWFAMMQKSKSPTSSISSSHWADNLSEKSTDLLIQATFQSEVLEAKVTETSKTFKKEENKWNFGVVKMHPYLVSERHIHRHFVNVALTLQNADASQQMSLGYAVIPLLGTCKSTRTLEVDVMLAGTRVATLSAEVRSALRKRVGYKPTIANPIFGIRAQRGKLSLGRMPSSMGAINENVDNSSDEELERAPSSQRTNST
mmetsp:Transcript_10875/g.17420  ORF Transcript_10875/g.17420 Transcript_10875/m.17420 type:complete len:1031 (+) Transcript_10875:195-3287(+)